MDPTAVRQQISRILSSEVLASKDQLRKLLEILARNIDSQPTLKPEEVIRELWPAEVRTKRSSDVATEMNRLRRAVRSYYKGEGQGDPILIGLPNRSVAAGNGTHEKRWITAEQRREEEQGRSQPASTLSRLGRIVTIAVLAAALNIGGLLVVRMVAMPEQPKSARVDGASLVVLNAEGKELWRKTFPQGFGLDSYYAQGLASRLWFADLEGKGHTSVLFSYLPPADAQPHSSTLICYSDRGKERWRSTAGRALPEVDEPSTYRTLSLGVLKAAAKRPPRIVALNSHDPWYGGPTQIAVLDGNGKTLSEYWHSGGLRDLALADLDGNGREVIIATGNAHGYDTQATVVVLDSEHVSGASKEVRPEFQIQGMGIAQEKLRLLFPRSDLNRGSFPYNFAIEPTLRHGNLRVTVLECLAPIGCPVSYEFDKDSHLVAAYPASDELRTAHDHFFLNGKETHTLSSAERAGFLRVRCLVGCQSQFVPVAEAYDPAVAFEKGWTAHSNPNGVWSYGYSSGLTGSVTPYEKTVRNGVPSPNAQYWLSPPVNIGNSPSAMYNDGPAYTDGNIDFLANQLVLVAGLGGQNSDLIFTAPAAGDYAIDGGFRGAQYGVGTVVGVVANGKVVFSSSVTSVGQTVPFHITESLQAGSKVIFSVGPGTGRQNTGLSATITRPCAPTDRLSSSPTGEITCSARSSP